MIVLLVYFALKFLIRLAMPYFLRYLSKKAGQQFEKFFGDLPNMEPRQKEGNITINKAPSHNSSRKGKKVGEYVDYEEVD